MKKFFKFLTIGFCSVLMLGFVAGCASIGISSKGAAYFEGKNESDLVKYFKYDGESVKANDDYDKILHFSNLVTIMYVDKTTVEKFKNKKYPVSISEFSFMELPDGCCLAYGETHVATVISNGQPVSEVYDEDVPSGGTPTYKKVLPLSKQGISVMLHRNNNSEVKSKIKSFNNAVQQYRAVKKSEDKAMLDKTPIGGEYYIYDIESNGLSYSDEKVGRSTAIDHKYKLQKVSVYEDSRSSTETHVAYVYNARENKYIDENGNQISAADAYANEKSYIAKGFSSRRNDKGISLTAYIKDGVVIKAESTGQEIVK